MNEGIKCELVKFANSVMINTTQITMAHKKDYVIIRKPNGIIELTHIRTGDYVSSSIFNAHYWKDEKDQPTGSKK